MGYCHALNLDFETLVAANNSGCDVRASTIKNRGLQGSGLGIGAFTAKSRALGVYFSMIREEIEPS